jgi:hypothetical protein
VIGVVATETYVKNMFDVFDMPGRVCYVYKQSRPKEPSRFFLAPSRSAGSIFLYTRLVKAPTSY